MPSCIFLRPGWKITPNKLLCEYAIELFRVNDKSDHLDMLKVRMITTGSNNVRQWRLIEQDGRLSKEDWIRLQMTMPPGPYKTVHTKCGRPQTSTVIGGK